MATDGQLRQRIAPHLDRFGPWVWSRVEISRTMGWNFCEAVEDANPIYWDEAFAEQSRFGRLLVPPQMIATMAGHHWWAPDFVRKAEERDFAQQGDDHPQRISDAIVSAGYATATNVGREDEFLEPFGPGDGHIRYARKVVGVSEPKQTRVGMGVFIDSVIEYRRERDDAVIARAHNAMLRYDPSRPRGS